MQTTLYRPVGRPELDLIAASDWRRFPPRLDWQPIFYPVLNEQYASRIAREWNTKDEDNGNVGYVLTFRVDAQYLAQFPVHQVGDADCQELWVPAGELEAFNDHIDGEIDVVREYRAPGATTLQLLITEDTSTPPPANPIADMTEPEFRRFVNMLLWLIQDENETLGHIARGWTEVEAGDSAKWGPWRPADCAALLSLWFEAGLLALHRLDSEMQAAEASELLSRPDDWDAETGGSAPFVAATEDGGTRPDPFWYALVKGVAGVDSSK